MHPGQPSGLPPSCSSSDLFCLFGSSCVPLVFEQFEKQRQTLLVAGFHHPHFFSFPW